ncbi:MAG: HAD-IA family hydrolase [Oscillospiraceae bacterium]|jgi:HAD superfamily hydrolase (TIGR01549 family)|nr:HAD-IA family hydrolase [Oscillospiraceae bacterium]
MKYTHIAFDIDGTLTNSEYAVLRSLQDTLTALRESSPSPEELAPLALGIPGADTMRLLGFEDVPAALSLWVDNLHKYQDTITLFPGVLNLLEKLREQGYTLGVVTSQTPEEYEADFAHSPAAPYFSILVRAGETAEGKPSPLPLLRFIDLAGCQPSKVLFVGDREGDLRCAQGAGVDFALAGWGNPTGKMAWTYRLEKPEDLLRYL